MLEAQELVQQSQPFEVLGQADFVETLLLHWSGQGGRELIGQITQDDSHGCVFRECEQVLVIRKQWVGATIVGRA